jgi:hypothetical protein
MTIGPEHDVGRRDVPVDETPAMEGPERPGDVDGQPQDAGLRQTDQGDERGEVLPVDEGPHQIRPPVDLAGGVDRRQPRMVQRAEEGRFAPKAAPRLGVELRGPGELDDDRQITAAGAEDHAVRAAADLLQALDPGDDRHGSDAQERPGRQHPTARGPA